MREGEKGAESWERRGGKDSLALFYFARKVAFMPMSLSELTDYASIMATEFAATLRTLFGTDSGMLIAAGVAYLLVLWLIFRAIRQSKNNLKKRDKKRDKKHDKKQPTPTRGLADMAKQNQSMAAQAQEAQKPQTQEAQEAQTKEPQAQEPEGDTPLSLADDAPDNMAKTLPTESAQSDTETGEPTVDNIMREIADKVTSEVVSNMTPDSRDDEPARHLAHLLEIEKQLRNLRELHQAGLIASEIYLHKTRDLASRVK